MAPDRRSRFAVALGLAVAALAPCDAGRADASSGMRVLELFTSQGCPRCPPADRLITDLAREPKTIALSYSVNTWDFAGWRDTLAEQEFTRRQHAYAAARGDRRVFTPQVIVDGVQAEAGADRAAIQHAAETLAADDSVMRIPLDLTESGGRLHIAVGAASAETGPASILILRVARQKTVDIDRGANSGQSVTYTNAVRALQKIGDWSGKPESFDLVELKADDEGYVVLLQAGTPEKPGAILAAAKSGL
ncbi:hypothetical protein RHAL1_03588 [Beijerinckiaceae bacterium RH AL1]|nr:DUF1223 domain-containing protein [Beijerinckiaceae bacterium]VVB48964.1 hypothetical protein RHCH11_RHCH11_03520 [Beijerinckiaceae bacterium RH CH11]VVB49043.1 hypothetical protein RHAL8_03516 [Beijerinckiaceae bacterium RH AL8]VVC56659.1 hypothetical protein RHAL1_03588 [Beijerinckiaceae bacterium RH AL1]